MAKTVKPAKSTTSKAPSSNGKIDRVSIRMYCLGTGDCFILKFLSGESERFTLMIDCGSCQGKPHEIKPYLLDLAKYVNNHVNLLVVTHEHNDHVNGFAKCEEIFEDPAFRIDEAWFAWTENPDDPDDRAKKLQEKRRKMKQALAKAISAMMVKVAAFQLEPSDEYFKPAVQEAQAAFLKGLDTMADINLPVDGGEAGASLPGMVKIKAMLTEKKTRVRYLDPGQTLVLENLPGFKFHVLGPPFERDYIFKDGREGVDVFKRKLNFYESALAANAFMHLGQTDTRDKDIPFAEGYILNETNPSIITRIVSSREGSTITPITPNSVVGTYADPENSWRKIDLDWLNSAGSLALRLNSHINNTSLALAIEAEDPEKGVILMPGDAEYGSWESWHAIENWKGKGANGKHFVEDLLNRTIFYKVGHHLSYNGTALQKGIAMMDSPKLAAMATLDRKRIAPGWKSTMPNALLLKELIRRCQGKLFIMNEFEIKNGPSKTFDPESLGALRYERKDLPGTDQPMYIQYTCMV